MILTDNGSEGRVRELRFYMGFVLFMSNASRAITIVLLPFFFIGEHPLWSGGQQHIGYAIACHPLGSILFSAFFGRISDLLGRHFALRLAFIGLILAYTTIIIGIHTRVVGLFFLGMVLTGLADATVLLSKSIICDVSEKLESIFNLSTLELGAGSGWVIGPILGGYLYNLYQYTSWYRGLPFMLIIAMYVILLMVFIIFLSRLPLKPRIKTSIKAFPFQYSIAMLLLAWLMFVLGSDILIQLLPTALVQKFKYSVMGVGQFVSIMGLFYTCMTFFIVMPMMRFLKLENKKVCALSLLVQAFMLHCFVGIEGSEYIYLYVLGFVAAQAFLMPIMVGIIASSVRFEYRGFILGITSTLQSLGVLIVGVVFAPMLSQHFEKPFLFAFIVLVLGSALMLGMSFGRNVRA